MDGQQINFSPQDAPPPPSLTQQSGAELINSQADSEKTLDLAITDAQKLNAPLGKGLAGGDATED
eukprot:1621300-Alexandrium_andersonii.AAC.1